VGIYSDPSVNTVPHPRAPGGVGQFVAALFLFEYTGGEVRPNEEVAAAQWVSLDHPPAPLLRSHAIRLEDLKRFDGAAFFR
jgi:hypothetical protein